MGTKRRGLVLVAALLAAVTAALVPALGATASTTSQAGGGRPQGALHVSFRGQGSTHGRLVRTVRMSAVPPARGGARTAGPAGQGSSAGGRDQPGALLL